MRAFGCVGRAIRVVRVIGEDDVEPYVFSAITTITYVLFEASSVNTTKLDKRPLSILGVTRDPFIE